MLLEKGEILHTILSSVKVSSTRKERKERMNLHRWNIDDSTGSSVGISTDSNSVGFAEKCNSISRLKFGSVQCS